MSEAAWVAATLVDARPQVIGALLRYFRELDTAEDAFQEASLRALARWPRTGPPRDPVAWLVLVARNTAIDGKRRARRNEALPEDDELAEPGDAEAREVERLDTADFRDDSLRLLFMCSHPKLSAAQQIALSLRVVSGLSVPEIARAFLVSEAAMEQRLTRAKRTIAETPIPFEAPGPGERRERIELVAASLYLLFNEGYAASGGEQRVRAPLCEEAIRLSRLLLSLFPQEADVCGLAALFLLQHARARARVDQNGEIVLLDDQDRALWDRELIDEGLALVEKAMLRGEGGRYALQAAIAAEHARAASAERTDWPRIERLYEALERLAPSPVVTLNRAVATAKTRGPAAALALIAPLEQPLAKYFPFFGVRGALLRDAGDAEGARAAFTRALALASSVPEASHIRAQLDRLGAPTAGVSSARPRT